MLHCLFVLGYLFVTLEGTLGFLGPLLLVEAPTRQIPLSASLPFSASFSSPKHNFHTKSLHLFPKRGGGFGSTTTAKKKAKPYKKTQPKTPSTASASHEPSIVYRRDYQAPEYRISHAFLDFNIVDVDKIVITATLTIAPSSSTKDLILNGDARFLDLQQVSIVDENGNSLQLLAKGTDYTVTEDSLVIKGQIVTSSGENVCLQTVVQHSSFDKRGNDLSGLYRRDGMFFTHCEPTGFRQISYFIDRPDNNAIFRVCVEASQTQHPLLLSNGNCVESGPAAIEGRHYVVFEDPHPKPSYIFAFVAAGASLRRVHDTYTTASGRCVDLNIYSDAPDMNRMQFALETLKKSMRWDEETYGLEYDLDVYNIVAVQHFVLGAMENKSLNLFQTSLIATNPQSTTDVTYDLVEKTVAHEYFHNWSGNRVTVRDWFEFALKEGLTVYRDQEFTADVGLRTVVRIEAVKILREKQFREDASESRHPVRPESALSSREHALDALASSTTYHKGAEVIRMYESILGKDGFRKGLRLYMERHDGTGATCDDFRKAMADANNVDLEQFALWLSKAGTPTVLYKFFYDDVRKTASLTLTQRLECDPEGLLHIPIKIGFLDKTSGDEVVPTTTLELKQRTETFEFAGLDNEVVPSVLRDFSAPVILVAEDGLRQDDAFLATYDTDGFNRWEAIQKLYSLCIFKIMRGEDVDDIERSAFEAFGHTLRDREIDPASKSYLLCLPTESVLARQLEIENPVGVHKARQELGRRIRSRFKSEIQEMYEDLSASIPVGEVRTDTTSRSIRALRNVLLDFLCFVDSSEEEQNLVAQIAMNHFDTASCLTDRLATFRTLSSMSGSAAKARDEATEKFYVYAKQNDPIVMHKWFQTQALSDLPDVLERVQNLTQHQDFKATNAGLFRSLVTSFTMNSRAFHSEESYRFIGSVISQMDRVAPQLAVELANKLAQWRRYDPERAAMMKTELRRIGAAKQISRGLALTVERALSPGK